MPDGQTVLRVPPHYVQLAAALGLNSQNMIESDAQPTDFESLIEMHRKHIAENRDNISSINVCTDLTNQNRSPNNNWHNSDSYTTAQKSMSPKTIADINCVLINSSNISNINQNDKVIDLKRDHRQLNNCQQQMDIDDQPSITLISPMPISSVTEKNGNSSVTTPTVINKLSPMTKNYDHFIGKKSYINNNIISSFDEQNNYKENRLYEENQNNQNFLNQNCDPNNANQGDDSMWRPW